MKLIIRTNSGTIYRTVTRSNIKKVAKGIHNLFPDSDYAVLYSVIYNVMEKGLTEFELLP